MFIAKLVQHFEIRAPQGVQLPDTHQEGATLSPSPFSAIFIPRDFMNKKYILTNI